jgi:Nicotianamine synthase protein
MPMDWTDRLPSKVNSTPRRGVESAVGQGHEWTGQQLDPFATARALRRTCRRLLSSPGDPDEEDRQVPRIQQLVTQGPDDRAWATEVLKRIPPSHAAASRAARGPWETRRELELVGRILTGEATLADYLFYGVAEQLIDQELALLPANPEDILFIGSGPLPLTAVLMHQQTGAYVTCIDCDPLAVAHSSRLLSKLRLDDAITVSSGRGEEVRIGRHDLVVIALLAQPKAAILANVANALRPDGHVLCRTSAGLKTLLYEPTEAILTPAFELVGEQIGAGSLAVSTLLLRPRRDL